MTQIKVGDIIIDDEVEEDLTPVSVGKQISSLNVLTAYIRTHRPKRSLFDMSRYLKVRGPWEHDE